MPADGITRILQDQNGYLWVGTLAGLARFDGVHFTTFEPINTPELKDGQITSLYESRHGKLWIGTARGLSCCTNGNFVSFFEKDGLSSERILCLGEDAGGHLWAGTDAGLNRLENSRFTSYFSLEGLPDDRINAMAKFGDNLIFATGKGLAEYGGVRFGPYKPTIGIPDDDIREMQASGAGNLWLSDGSGLWRLEIKEPTTTISQIYKGPVTSFRVTIDGTIWIGTGEGDLEQLTVGGNGASCRKIAHFPSAVSALCEDREHDLWVGTANNGLYRLKRREVNVTYPAGPGQQAVCSLTALSSNEVWFATISGMLYCWTANGITASNHFPRDIQVRVVAGNTNSGLWFGTSDDGLFHLSGGRTDHWDELDGLSDNDIESIFVGNRKVWLGTRNGGFNCLEDGRIERFLTPWGLTGNYASVITRDASGRIWIGTTGDGLYCLSNTVFSAYTDKNGLPNDDIRALMVDDEQVLWIGTDNGLVRLQGKRLTTFSKQDGLPDDSICQLQQDNLGNLWIGCNSGIFRLQKSQLRDYAEGRTGFIDVVPYGEPDGLPPLQCLPDFQITRTGTDDQVWFAGTRNLVSIEPDKIHWNLMPPPVVIEQVFEDNVPVSREEPIRIPAGTDRIQFQFTALSLVSPEKVWFRCRLAGFDRAWVNLGDKRTAQYTHVPPGVYRFEVTACNNDGVWSQTGASLAVVIAPFWWETTWFKLASVGGIAAFVFGILRQRRARVRELEKLRMRIAGDLHDELGSSLWSITLLSQMLNKHGQMGSEERRDTAEIHRIARQTSNAIRDIVWIINPAFDTMQDLVQRMKDFAGTMLRGMESHVKSEGLNLSRRLTLGFRENVFLMYKEILTNVAKHARASTVEISLRELTDAWDLSVTDNGIGFDTAVPSAGNGLPNLCRRAEKIQATVRVCSKPGQGTTVRLTIPKFAEGPLWKRKLRKVLYENHEHRN